MGFKVLGKQIFLYFFQWLRLHQDFAYKAVLGGHEHVDPLFLWFIQIPHHLGSPLIGTVCGLGVISCDIELIRP